MEGHGRQNCSGSTSDADILSSNSSQPSIDSNFSAPAYLSTSSSPLPTTIPPDGQLSYDEIRTFYIFNVRGLCPTTVPSKVPYLCDLLSDKNQLFIALTETWLHSHKDAELKIEGYQIFRSDRKRKGNGEDIVGVWLYTYKILLPVIWRLSSSTQMVWLKF